MRKIKILHVITGLGGGGAETMLYSLLSRIDKDKFDVYVISMQDEGVFGKKIEALGIPVTCLNMKKGFSSVAKLFAYWRLLKNVNPDIVQGWMYHANLFVILGKFFYHKSSVIFAIHSSLPYSDNNKSLTKWVIRANIISSYFCKRVLFCSEVSRLQHIKLGFKKVNSIYIPNGFDMELFAPSVARYQIVRQELGIDASTKIIGMFARFDPMKNHEDFLKMGQMIKKNHDTNTKFLMVGNDITYDNLSLAQKIRDFGLEKDVFLLGYVKSEDYMPAIDILVLSSSWGEAFPMVVGEAMACGVPCVVTDVGDCKNILRGLGSICKVGDYEQLAKECISWLVATNVEVKMQLRQHVIDHYSIDYIVNQYENLYLDVLNK